LLGHVNPSGRLPATFEKRLEDRSSFDCYHESGDDRRVQLADGVFTGYRHFDRSGIEPRFPFGFGLSYTSFEYARLELGSASLEPGQSLLVSVDVRNTGDRRGAEVVQLYLSELEPAVPRPVKELAGFAKVWLDPGEVARVTLRVAPESLRYYDAERKVFTYQPGQFEVSVGAHAGAALLRQAFHAS
jgi:beta-glucosidase